MSTNEPDFASRPTRYVRPVPTIRSPTEDILRQTFARVTPLTADQAAAAESRRLTQMLAEDLGARYSPSRATLATYLISEPGAYGQRQQAVRDRIERWSQDIVRHVRECHNVILFGAMGTGKDHLLAALLYRAAAAGIACRWRDCLDLYGAFRDRIDAKQSEDGLLGQLAAPRVLGLSDLVPPAGALKEGRIEILRRVLERRARADRPTWVTVNAESLKDLEVALTSPVWDRLQDGALVVGCFWPTYRERRKADG